MPNTANKSVLIAVSGGLDSTVLLFALAKNLQAPNLACSNKIDLLIQNFIKDTNLNQIEAIYLDHSQRPDTKLDLQAVQKICTKFNLTLNHQKLDLPPNCSEELARKNRYQALSLTLQKKNLDHIITAHHADDVLETALINLKRGSGPKGLSSLAHHPNGTWRPFLANFQNNLFITKADLLNYAKLNKLTWHEDSTNQSSNYFRNRLRVKLKTSHQQTKQKFLNLLAASSKLNSALNIELTKLDFALRHNNLQQNLYSRPNFLKLEPKLQQQFIHLKLSQLGYDVNQQSVKRAVQFVQEAKTSKTIQLKGCHITILQKDTFLFQPLAKK